MKDIYEEQTKDKEPQKVEDKVHKEYYNRVMKGKDFLALTVGFNLLGGIIAGILLGYALDRWLMEGIFKFKTFPFGMLFFFFVGIISGFLNAYRDLKRIE